MLNQSNETVAEYEHTLIMNISSPLPVCSGCIAVAEGIHIHLFGKTNFAPLTYQEAPSLCIAPSTASAPASKTYYSDKKLS